MSYAIFRGEEMKTARIFKNGRSQAVRLPKDFQFQDDQVFIQKHGEAVILVPQEKAWAVFMEGINSFTADFMKDGRDQGKEQERETI
jgi:antitoxin VapB